MARYIRPTSTRRLPGRTPFVVSALRRKYAEVKGRGDAEAMAHVGATLLLFAPDEDLTQIGAIRPHKALRERWTVTALGILRRANAPMTGRELARAVMQERGVAQSDFKRLKSIECALHATLERLEGLGVVREDGEPKRWSAER